MHEYRRRVSQAVDAVENAAMAWDQSGGVLHAGVALHRRHDDVAEEAGNPEDEACERGPAHIHRCEIGAGKRRNESGGGEAADQTLPGLLRADMRRYLVAAHSLPQQYCATSLNCVSTTRKKRSPIPPPTGFTASPDTSSHAMWESVNTVIISPQESVPTARRKPSVWPRSTMSGGRNRNIHTGTNTMNMPYQSIAAQ